MTSPPTGWKTKPLIECTSDGNLSYGVVQPGKHRDDGVPILRVNNFVNGALDLSTVMKIDQAIEQTHLRTRLTGGEVLLTLVGSTGQTVIVDERLAGWNVARAVAVIRPSYAVGSKWINICLRSHATKTYLDSRANTTVQKTLNLSDVRQIPVIIPPKETKEFIESCISTLDDKIELNRRMNETLESMARALFKSWFVDFDPVIDNALAAGNPIPEPLHARAEARRALGAQRKPLPAHIQKLFPDTFHFDEGMGWIPEEWCVQSIGKTIELSYGKSLPAGKRVAGNVPVYGSGGVSGWHNESLCEGPGLVVGRKGTVGTLYWVPENYFPIDTVFYVNNKSDAPLYWIYQSLQLIDIQSMGADSAVPGVNRNTIYARNFTLPSPSVWEAYWTNLEPMTRRMEALDLENQTLARLRDTLLPKLLSGELRIPDAEQLVAGSL